MGESLIVRRGGKSSEATTAPTITIVSETQTGVTFTLTNNDDNTALITFEIDNQIGGVELAAAAVSSNITVALAAGTYTLSAFATVVGEVATQSTAAVEIIVIPAYEELFSTTVATNTTQIDITGLSIGKDATLRLVYNFVGSSSSSNTDIALFPNDLTTKTNYHTQRFQGQDTSLSAIRTNESQLCFFVQSVRKSAGFADIKVSNNDRFVFQSQFNLFTGSVASNSNNTNNNVIGTQTVSSITKLSIVSTLANGIAVGSKIALYKVTEAA